MSDLIRREDVLELLNSRVISSKGIFGDLGGAVSGVRELIKVMPSAEPEEEVFEWCHDCKEYDQEKHCCHRWTKVIRQTIAEVKQQYALEHPEIVHCNECFYAESADDKEDGYRCTHAMNQNRSVIWFGGDFCSYGERNDE